MQRDRNLLCNIIRIVRVAGDYECPSEDPIACAADQCSESRLVPVAGLQQ
jgi:hypothetical protein